MTELTLGELTTAEEPRYLTGDDEDDDDDGPPPGFNCIASPAAANSEEDIEIEEQIEEEEEEEEEADALGDDEEDMDGPPPGWSSIQPPDVEMSEKQQVPEDEDEDPRLVWKLVPPISQDDHPTDKGVRIRQKGVQSGPKTSPPPPSLLLPHIRPQAQPQAPAPLPSDKGQMVCGSCQQLLSYPRGVKYVKCSCCQTVNLVLEANQVGQVKCGGCAVLLMYPHGAPSVKCCSCRFVTDIGARNRQPPLSTQQAQRRSSLNIVH